MSQIDSDTLQSTSSQLSIGFPERISSQPSKISFSPYAGPLSSDKNVPTMNECCIAIYCARHEKLLLAKLKSKGLYLPNFMIKPSDSWFDVANKSIEHLFETQKLTTSCIFTGHHLLDILRIQLPKKSPNYLTRVTFVMSIDHELVKENENDCQSLPEDMYKWATFDEIKKSDLLWGIEPIEVFILLKEYCKKLKTKDTNFSDMTLPTLLNEYNAQDATKHLTTMDSKYQKERELLLSAKFTTEEVQKLYNEFVIQCFPSQYMTYASFKIFMNKIGWVNEEEILYKMVFRSYTSSVDTSKPYQYLTFDELIVGLAAMEERADHRANCLQLRLRYIFHFYDSDEDGKLNLNELNQMVADIKKKPQVTEAVSNEMLRKESMVVGTASTHEQDNVVAEILRRIGNVSVGENAFITLKQLVDSAETERNGIWIAEMTETLFRSNISTIDVASVKFDYKFLIDLLTPLKIQSAVDRYDEPCEMCHSVHFNMCAHAIKIDEHGLLRGTIKFDVSPFYRDTPFVQELKISEQDFSLIITELHRLSLLAISAHSSLNGSLDVPRPVKDKELISNVRQILKLVKEVVKREPLVTQLSAPCFIIGELWANLPNLHALISSISRMAPFVNPVNILFMGNYVDPNYILGVESILYLFCFKILMPTRITMLRGRTEFRVNVIKSKFYQDCVEYFSVEIFNEIYDIFELLPFVAIIDERLFISKSGIPLANQTIDKIKVLNPTKKQPIRTLNSTDINNIVLGKPMKNSKKKAILKKISARAKRKEDSAKRTRSKEKNVRKSRSVVSGDRHVRTKTIPKGSKNSKRRKSPPKTKKPKPNKKSQMCKSKSESRVSLTSKTNSVTSNLSSNIVCEDVGFTASNLKQFLRRNHFSHFIRTDVLQTRSFQLQCETKLITIGGIGMQSDAGKMARINGIIVLANRQKIRLLKFENYNSIIEL